MTGLLTATLIWSRELSSATVGLAEGVGVGEGDSVAVADSVGVSVEVVLGKVVGVAEELRTTPKGKYEDRTQRQQSSSFHVGSLS